MSDPHMFDDLIQQALQMPLAQQVALLQRLATAIEASLGEPVLLTPSVDTHQPLMNPNELNEITYKIVGCAMAVHRRRGPGLRENTYQRDLETQFRHADLLFTPQRIYEVFDSVQERKLIGYYIPDFLVEDRVIVEIKALNRLDNLHIAQLIGYLAVSGCRTGLLINFGERSLQWKRILPPRDVQAHAINRRWLFVPDWMQENAMPRDDKEA